MARPRVFVSSTYYDLRHVRNSIQEFVERLGYDVVLFERGDIAFAHDIPLDESCYREIDNCHIMVLIIGGRYGSPSSSQSPAIPEQEEKLYQSYNSITKKEYETARSKDIPIFIFVDRGVLAEHRTYKLNRHKSDIQYAHVDSTNVFRLLDDILSQHRNNFVKDFEKFEEIADWLREQWAGLFAGFLLRKSTETQLAALNTKIQELGEVTHALRTYSESMMRKIKPENYRRIISTQEKKIRQTKARSLAREGMIQYLRGGYELGVTPEELLSALEHSDTLEAFLVSAGLPEDKAKQFISDHELPARADFEDFKRRFSGSSTTEADADGAE